MATNIARHHITIAEAAAQLPQQSEAQLRFATLLQRGTLEVELYAPQGHDAQQPHRKDEIYVVIAGTGVFLNGGVRHAFGPGDLLFVAAGVEHRFESFSDDFQSWVIFYGPDGGELTGDA
jgi:mannose-6-phosphate isomerase-like protein (cupin superfamily)